MNKPSLTGQKRFHQGTFKPKNPQKYLGNPTNILYRSGWEKYFLQWCDITPSVVGYGSEELIIPYVSPVDGRLHRYYIDFVVLVKQQNGEIKKFAVEIKPYTQTQPPKISSKRTLLTESLKKKIETYSINQAKWEAARKFCSQHNLSFIILTERELLKGKKK
jgi:hypothetical protein